MTPFLRLPQNLAEAVIYRNATVTTRKRKGSFVEGDLEETGEEGDASDECEASPGQEAILSAMRLLDLRVLAKVRTQLYIKMSYNNNKNK